MAARDMLSLALDSQAEPTPSAPIIRAPADDTRPTTPDLSSDSEEEEEDDSDPGTPDKERPRAPLMLLPQLRRTQKSDNLRGLAKRGLMIPDADSEYIELHAPLQEQEDGLVPVDEETASDLPDCPLDFTPSSEVDPTPTSEFPEFDHFSYPPPPADDEGLVLIELPCRIRISGSMSTAPSSVSGEADEAFITTTTTTSNDISTEPTDVDIDGDELYDSIQADDEMDEYEPESVSSFGISPVLLILMMGAMLGLIAWISLPARRAPF